MVGSTQLGKHPTPFSSMNRPWIMPVSARPAKSSAIRIFLKAGVPTAGASLATRFVPSTWAQPAGSIGTIMAVSKSEYYTSAIKRSRSLLLDTSARLI